VKKTLLIALIMVMLLAACAPVAPAPAPAAIQPTVETQAPAPTAVPTQAAQPTQAPTEAPAPVPTQAASPTLTTNPWQWVGFTSPVEQFKLDQPGNYLVTFQEDGTVAIKADCNNAGGTYTADDSSLMVKIGPTTMAACPDGSRGDQFIKMLGGFPMFGLESF